MSRQNVMIFQNMRPPVAADKGNSPLRGKQAKQIFHLANGNFEDRTGQRVTKEQIVQNYMDSGTLQDSQWDGRHHLSPSRWNTKNKSFLKQYFGKDSKNTDKIMLNPQRTMDPYDENEMKGTRMPEYTKLTQERDIYGELGWVPNFNVKVSKDNQHLHPTFRETFDGPQAYHRRFNTAAMTTNEFFRQNAPKTSVARAQRLPKPQNGRSNSPNNSPRSFNRSFIDRRSTTTDESQMGGSRYDTPFMLNKSPGNTFKVVPEIERTVKFTTEIPFLRSKVNPSSFAKTHTGGFGASAQSPRRQRQQARTVLRLERKEGGWCNNIKPISQYNSKVHPSMRIVFEKI